MFLNSNLLQSRTQESANLNAAIREIENRGEPFILSIGTSLYIVIDNVVFAKADTSTEALLIMMCAQFVFQIHYSPYALPSFLFVESQCLHKLPDDGTILPKTVTNFITIIGKLNSNEA